GVVPTLPRPPPPAPLPAVRGREAMSVPGQGWDWYAPLEHEHLPPLLRRPVGVSPLPLAPALLPELHQLAVVPVRVEEGREHADARFVGRRPYELHPLGLQAPLFALGVVDHEVEEHA